MYIHINEILFIGRASIDWLLITEMREMKYNIVNLSLIAGSKNIALTSTSTVHCPKNNLSIGIN